MTDILDTYANSTSPGGGDTDDILNRYASAPPPAPAKGEKGIVNDALVGLGKGVMGLPEAATGLADIPAGLMGLDRPFDKATDIIGKETGFQPSKWNKEAEKDYSPAMQEATRNINQAWQDPNTGALDVAKAYAQNPRGIMKTVVESLPSMFAGNFIGGKLVGLGGDAARTMTAQELAKKAAFGGAVGEGSVMAGQAMSNIDESVDPQTAALASLATGVGGGVIGGTSNRIANKFGVGDIDQIIASGGRAGLAEGAEQGATRTFAESAKAFGKRVGAGALQEGLIEEGSQSALETAMQNLAEGKPITENMARNVVEGTLAGGVMGAGANVYAPSKAPIVDPAETAGQTQEQISPPEEAQELSAPITAEAPPVAPTQATPSEPQDPTERTRSYVDDVLKRFEDKGSDINKMALTSSLANAARANGIDIKGKKPVEIFNTLREIAYPPASQTQADIDLAEADRLEATGGLAAKATAANLRNGASTMAPPVVKTEAEEPVAEAATTAEQPTTAEAAQPVAEPATPAEQPSAEVVEQTAPAEATPVSEAPPKDPYSPEALANESLSSLTTLANNLRSSKQVPKEQKKQWLDVINAERERKNAVEQAAKAERKQADSLVDLPDLTEDDDVTTETPEATAQTVFEVNGQKVDYNALSDDQKAQWDEAETSYRNTLKFIALNQKIQRDSRLKAKEEKAAGMQHAAERRRITGLLTDKEKLKVEADAKKIRVDSTVELEDGRTGVATSRPAFGNVKIKFEDGSVENVPSKTVRVAQKPTETQPPTTDFDLETGKISDQSPNTAAQKAEEPAGQEVAPVVPIDQGSTTQNEILDQTPEADKQNGDYPKTRVQYQDLDIALENGAGSIRSGKDETGREWSQTMHDDYGEIPFVRDPETGQPIKTEGADKDHIDVFIKPKLSPEDTQKLNRVFIVDQVNPKTGAYDEHKVLLGYTSVSEAKKAYNANYEPGWKGGAAVTGMPMAKFKEWLLNGDTKAPINPKVVEAYRAKNFGVSVEPTPVPEVAPEVAPKQAVDVKSVIYEPAFKQEVIGAIDAEIAKIKADSAKLNAKQYKPNKGILEYDSGYRTTIGDINEKKRNAKLAKNAETVKALESLKLQFGGVVPPRGGLKRYYGVNGDRLANLIQRAWDSSVQLGDMDGLGKRILGLALRSAALEDYANIIADKLKNQATPDTVQDPAPRQAQEVAPQPVPEAPKARKEGSGKRGKVQDSDPLLTVIFKLGGLSKTEAAQRAMDESGFGLFGKRLFNDGKNAKTYDEMAELLRGYEFDVADPHALETMVAAAVNQGTLFLNPRGWELYAELQAKEKFNEEQAKLAMQLDSMIENGDISVDELTDEAIDAIFASGPKVSLDELFGTFTEDYEDVDETPGDAGGELPADEALSDYTEDDLAERERNAAASAAAERKAVADAEAKRKADLEVDTLADEMLGNIGTRDVFDDTRDVDTLYSFAGPKSKTAVPLLLSSAEERLARGDDPETVRRETGWFVGEDGFFRYEISDSDARIKLDWFNGLEKFISKYRMNATIKDLLHHPRLFAAYPQFADYGLSFRPSWDLGGQGGIIGKRIFLASDQSKAEMLEVITHELQHAIQNYEGFAEGGTPESITPENYLDHQREMLDLLDLNIAKYKREHNDKMLEKVREQKRTLMDAANFKAYKRLAGEVEARNTQKRLKMTDRERMKKSPFQTADFRGRDVIVRINGRDLTRASAMPPANADADVLPEKMNIDGVERWTVNSNGAPIAQTAEGVKNFWKWFGDSKVVDKDGKPLVVYHGTTADFSIFDPEKIGSNRDPGWLGRGFYFASDKKVADSFNGRAIDSFIKLRNPLILEMSKGWESKFITVRKALGLDTGAGISRGVTEEAAKEITDAAKEQGYDGVVLDYSSTGYENVEVVAFENTQIKSAIGNSGDFDPQNPNIQMSQDTGPEMPVFENAQEAIDHLLKSTGPGIQTLLDNGVLNFTHGKKDWPLRNPDARAEAVYTNNKIYVDLNVTGRDRLDAVILHEIGEHYGLRRMLGTEGYNSLLGAIRSRAKIKGSQAERVWNEVKAEYTHLEEGSDKFVAEVIAKLGEYNPQAPWYKRLLAQIKSFLIRMGLARGLTAGTITEADLHQLLITSLQASANVLKKGEGRFYGGTAEAYSVKGGSLPEKMMIDGVERWTVNSNGAPIAQTAEGVKNFWEWFGDSKVVDKDGKPLVVYHGTHGDFTEFRGTKKAHLGFHFGDIEAADNRLDMTSDGRLDFEEIKRLNDRAAEIYKKFRDFENYLRGKNQEVPTDEIASVLESDGDLSELFKKYDYAPTTEEKATLERLRKDWDDAKLPITKYGLGSSVGRFYLSADKLLRLRDVGNWGSVAKIKEALPFEVDAKGLTQLKNGLMEKGYQGIVYENLVENPVMRTDSFIVFEPEQIKSAIGNNGDFDPQNPNIQYSLPTNPANAVPPGEYNAAYDTWMAQVQRKAENMSDALFKNRLAVFTAHQLTELGQYIMPGLKEYDKLLLAREATVAEWMRGADRLVSQVWKDIPKPMQFDLSGVMHDSTLADVDASKGWRFVEADEAKQQFRAATQATLGKRSQTRLEQAAMSAGAIKVTKNSAFFATEKAAQDFLSQLEGIETRQRNEAIETAKRNQTPFKDENADRKAALTALQQRYAPLSDQAKQVYAESNKQHQALFQERLATLEARIEAAVLNMETRKQLLAEVRQKFESASLNWYYAPLSRFGDHWFYGTDANGKNWFITAESEPARDRKLKEFEDAGGRKRGDGTNLSGVDKATGQDATDGFVTNILGVLDANNAVSDETRTALKDEIYQLYLETLPDVSVRHNAMHRKGTLGFDADAMRAFSSAMHHGSTQLANMKFGGTMKQVLADHERALEIANSKFKKASAENKIKAAELLRDNWTVLTAPDKLESELAAATTDAEKDLMEAAITLRNQLGKFNNESMAAESIDELIGNEMRILDAARLIPRKDNRKAADLLSELNKSYQAAMNTNSSDMDRTVTKINQLNFLGMLGFSLSAGLVNTLQTPGVAMPVTAGRHGVAATIREYDKGFKEFLSAFMRQKKDADGNTSISELLREDLHKAAASGNSAEITRLINELNALERFKEDGTISRTQTFDIIGVGQEGSDYGGVLSDLSKKAGFLFHHGERFNREVTLIANYRLETERLKAENTKIADPKARLKNGQIHQQAMDYAKYVVDRAHLDYASENAARIFRGPLAKMAFQFKKYSQGMLFLWGKSFADSLHKIDRADFANDTLFEQAKREQAEARRTFMGLLAMQTSLAGITGLPLMGALSVVYGLIGQAAGDDDDEPWDLERDLRLGLSDLFGEAAGEAMAKGIVNAGTPINLSSRLDQANIFFREPMKELEGRDAATNYVAQVFGPTGGTIEKVWQGFSFLADGQAMRGAEQLLPKFVSDLVKAGRFASEDVTSLSGEKVKDITATEIFWQTLGFSPSSVERKYAERNFTKARETAITEARSAIIHEAVKARMDGQAVDRAAIDEWNGAHPEFPITLRSIMASLRGKKESLERKGDRGFSVNPKLEYLYEENDLMD